MRQFVFSGNKFPKSLGSNKVTPDRLVESREVPTAEAQSFIIKNGRVASGKKAFVERKRVVP